MKTPWNRTSRGPLVAVAAAAAVAVGGGAALAVGPLGTADRSADLAGQIDSAKPRNVILLIGDGTDDSIITAARNYEKGAGGRFEALDALPFTGDMTTHGLKVGTGPDYPIAYVSDSAPTASGWSTGHKTVDSRLSQGPSASDAEPGTDYETVLEKYRAQGKRTGNVSTAAITDATPAAAAAHINLRACQGPQDMANCGYAKKANGGKGSVAEQLVDNRIDVILGGGRNRYMQATDAGPTVLDYAKSQRSYRDVKTKAEMDAITSLDGGPVLGLFSGGTDANPTSTSGENMKPLYDPLVAAAPPGAGSPTQRCTVADRGTQPRLAEMTKKAIDLLDNPKGFFLQVESAMVDKQEHGSDICGAVGDVAELDRATKVALDYQATHPDTLIVVTGDHAHSTQIVPGTSSGKQTATLQTADGDPMYVAYSTQDSGSSHTGAQIRVAAKGPQAANVTGLIDQTDLFQTLLGRAPSTLPGGPTTTVTTPGPTTTVTGPTKTVTAPAATPKPGAGLALGSSSISRRALRSGVAVSVVARDAQTVRVELRRGSKRLASKTLGASGGSARLKAKTGRGTLKVVVTATGKGGTATSSRSLRVR